MLGRPWIHSAGAIPSSLHQKVKFIINGQIITVLGEQDYNIYKDTAIPYIGEESPEDFGLQIFEEVCVLEEGETTQVGTFGLGYAPTMEEVREMKLRMKGKRGELLYHNPEHQVYFSSTSLHSRLRANGRTPSTKRAVT